MNVGRSPWLRCPGCSRDAWDPSGCSQCGRTGGDDPRWIDALGAAAPTGAGPVVAEFYDRRPFPGYAPDDDGATLCERAGRSPFLRELDRVASPEATVLDLGCGTGQSAAFLALQAVRRTVVACDLSRGALAEAAAFRARARLDRLTLVRADLFGAPLTPRSFDLVLCRGVVHHTADPARATAAAASFVAPGGHLVLGWYDRFGRAFHQLRVAAARLRGRPFDALDPILRDRRLAPDKREAWIADQYLHPVERRFGLGDVLAALRGSGLEFVRTTPPHGPLDRPTGEPTPVRRAALAARLWMRGFVDSDAGLIAATFRRPAR